MEDRLINKSDLGPEISLEANGSISIIGRSMMEDASLYYQQAHEWIGNYVSKMDKMLIVDIDLSYFNSSSAKQLLKLLTAIEEAEIEGKVNWIYPKENDILLERGQELEFMLDLPFNYTPK